MPGPERFTAIDDPDVLQGLRERVEDSLTEIFGDDLEGVDPEVAEDVRRLDQQLAATEDPDEKQRLKDWRYMALADTPKRLFRKIVSDYLPRYPFLAEDMGTLKKLKGILEDYDPNAPPAPTSPPPQWSVSPRTMFGFGPDPISLGPGPEIRGQIREVLEEAKLTRLEGSGDGVIPDSQ